jgi:hypothetical protein
MVLLPLVTLAYLNTVDIDICTKVLPPHVTLAYFSYR